jgi:hypothetical protein
LVYNNNNNNKNNNNNNNNNNSYNNSGSRSIDKPLEPGARKRESRVK